MCAIYVAEFQNEFIECETAEDASDLMTADILLTSNSSLDFTALELERLITTLIRYDLPHWQAWARAAQAKLEKMLEDAA